MPQVATPPRRRSAISTTTGFRRSSPARTSPNNNKIVAFKWNGSAWAVMWEATGAPSTDRGAWDGVSIHDLNDDGFPEVIARYGEVYDGAPASSSRRRRPGHPRIDPCSATSTATEVELVANQVFTWTGTGWTMKIPASTRRRATTAVEFYAFADFGTRNARRQLRSHKEGRHRRSRRRRGAPRAKGIDEQSGFVGIYTLQGERASARIARRPRRAYRA